MNVAPFNARGAEPDRRARLDTGARLLRRHVPQARQVVRKLLGVSLAYTLVTECGEPHYSFEGRVRFDRLVAGLALPQVLTSPAGGTDVWDVEIHGDARVRSAGWPYVSSLPMTSRI